MMEIDLKSALKIDQWFHSIQYDSDCISSGRKLKNKPSNYTLYGTLKFLEKISLANQKCVDIGTMDGLIAFTLKQKGAERVIATDIAYRHSFHLGKHYLNLDIEYKYPVKIDQLEQILENEKLDLVVCAGVLYHVFEPLSALINCRNILKNNGLLILETQYLSKEKHPVISFSPSDSRLGNQHANVFFVPSYHALCGMMNTAGFDILATVSNHGRITLLCKAVKPSLIQSKYQHVERTIKKYKSYVNYKENIDYEKWESTLHCSSIHYDGSYLGDYYLKLHDFQINNNLQPIQKLTATNYLLLKLQDKFRKKITEFARRKYLKFII